MVEMDVKVYYKSGKDFTYKDVGGYTTFPIKGSKKGAVKMGLYIWGKGPRKGASPKKVIPLTSLRTNGKKWEVL